jgi:glycosyltransferase involved in cell wall biosynthesis
MRENRKIAIIGHFGAQENFLDGQTIRTRIFYDELRKATDWKIQVVDTYYRKTNPVKLAWETFTALITTKDIVVLLSRNGMHFYFPILKFMSKLFGTRVYHNAIGGGLAGYVNEHPELRECLKAFRENWVQGQNMKDDLAKQGVYNVEVLPNFKRLNVVPESELCLPTVPPYRFCTFSRVMREKGIETAIEAIEAINAKAGYTLCTLDIYGKVDDTYQERFDLVMEKATAAIRYGGMIPFDKSVEAIKDYYALLFPTYWEGEGFAGTVVDAFSAGLPVIATDWNCNSEVIEHGMSGILYPNGEITNLQQAIEWAIENPVEVSNMKKRCVRSVQRFQPDHYVKWIVDRISSGFEVS